MSIREYLEEDLALGDITSESLLGNEKGKARIFTKEPIVVAGIEEAVEVFGTQGAKVAAMKQDGERASAGETLLTAEGPLKGLMAGERLALNFIGRMSGIATMTARALEVAREANPKIRIAATRKTTPGFRLCEKKAVELGGGERHRFNLGDAVLIKDNHIAVVGSVEEAVKRVKARQLECTLEVEVESLEDAICGAREGADVVMLDNMGPGQCAEVYRQLKGHYPDVVVEVSGGITIDNVAEYAPNADVISMGCLTSAASSADVSMEMVKQTF